MAQGNRYRPYDAPYESDYPSYDDRYAEPVDLDSLGSQVRSAHSSRSVATREEFLPEDSVPLFLSGADEEMRSSKFARPRKTGSRLLKTGAFAVAALVATFVAVKNPFTVFANATASLMGTSEVRQAAAPPPAAPPRQAAATAVASTPAMVAGPALATAAAPLPSRDEIAAALKTAHQNVAPPEPPQATTTVATAAPTATVPVVAAVPAAPAPAVAVAPPIRRIGADELANLMSRGKALLQSGDIAPARLLLERAAEAGEASAALMVAETYDPAVLGTQDARNITADPAQARHWYQRAAQLGSADAQRRLSQLQ